MKQLGYALKTTTEVIDPMNRHTQTAVSYWHAFGNSVAQRHVFDGLPAFVDAQELLPPLGVCG